MGVPVSMWSPPPTVPSSTGLGPFPAPVRRLGFFERLRIGWQLTKVSLSILRREKGLIVLPFLSLLTTGFAGAAWGVITYLVVPVLIFEKVGPWAAVKRSGSLLRKTWGEAMGGYFSLGAIFILLALPGLLLFIGGVAIGGIVGLLVGAGIAVVYWLILGLLGAAAQSILVTALYRYATTGKLGFGFPESLLAGRSQ